MAPAQKRRQLEESTNSNYQVAHSAQIFAVLCLRHTAAAGEATRSWICRRRHTPDASRTHTLSLAPFFAAEKRVKKFLRCALKNRPQLRDLFNPNFSAPLTARRLGSWPGGGGVTQIANCLLVSRIYCDWSEMKFARAASSKMRRCL